VTNPLLRFSASPVKVQLPSGTSASIPACFSRFELWHGTPIQDTYGKKAVLDWKGEPLFAELVILRLIHAEGWEGVWIDTYRKKFRQFMPPHSCGLPEHAQAFLDRVNAGRKWPAGCPDVLAWGEGQYFFVEVKRKRRDRIRKTQLVWLESALATRMPIESFLVLEWEIADKNGFNL
jgi:hypothetical protein